MPHDERMMAMKESAKKKKGKKRPPFMRDKMKGKDAGTRYVR
jgi:hypothetical protein